MFDLTAKKADNIEDESDLSEDPQEVAEREGLLLVEPLDQQLLLDIDNQEDEEVYRRMSKVCEMNGVFLKLDKRTTSRNGNVHLYVTVEDCTGQIKIDPLIRIAFQACFGSDRKRELLSLFRVLFDLDRPPTVFFEKADV